MYDADALVTQAIYGRASDNRLTSARVSRLAVSPGVLHRTGSSACLLARPGPEPWRPARIDVAPAGWTGQTRKRPSCRRPAVRQARRTEVLHPHPATTENLTRREFTPQGTARTRRLNGKPGPRLSCLHVHIASFGTSIRSGSPGWDEPADQDVAGSARAVRVTIPAKMRASSAGRLSMGWWSESTETVVACVSAATPSATFAGGSRPAR